MQQTLSQKLTWFMRDHEEVSNQRKTRTELLRDVYMKTGCTKPTDGSVVCLLFPSMALFLCLRLHACVRNVCKGND